jgi:hypothetical protein
MAKKSQKYIEASQDIRVVATTRIWIITVSILAICIPLASVTRSGSIIPLAAIGGAAVSTAAVWRSDEKKSKPHSLQPQQIELLEQRIADLETIVSSDDFDMPMKIKQLEAKESAKPTRLKRKA